MDWIGLLGYGKIRSRGDILGSLPIDLGLGDSVLGDGMCVVCVMWVSRYMGWVVILCACVDVDIDIDVYVYLGMW